MLLSAAMALPTFAAGWQRDGRGWWYQYADGHYAAGQWEQMQGSWYYFDTDGYMATGWRQIDGKWYYLSSSGEMLRNTTTPDGYRVGIDGSLPDDAGNETIAGTWHYVCEISQTDDESQYRLKTQRADDVYYIRNQSHGSGTILQVEEGTLYLGAVTNGEMALYIYNR
ncbi:hypothetical protein [Stomatobaculum longum]|uniref:hypothetical protein n=1 Tax=Stomatobaculum longum TaxID=796942 RepID=UPI002806347C|nr:hypothetical protein [Stomatobaculum longum]